MYGRESANAVSPLFNIPKFPSLNPFLVNLLLSNIVSMCCFAIDKPVEMINDTQSCGYALLFVVLRILLNYSSVLYLGNFMDIR